MVGGGAAPNAGLAAAAAREAASQSDAKIPENRTITRVVIGIVGCAKAKHAFTLLIFESFLSSTKMVDETLARHGPVCVLRIRDNGVCRGSATWCQFAILTNQTLPGVPCHN